MSGKGLPTPDQLAAIAWVKVVTKSLADGPPVSWKVLCEVVLPLVAKIAEGK